MQSEALVTECCQDHAAISSSRSREGGTDLDGRPDELRMPFKALEYSEEDDCHDWRPDDLVSSRLDQDSGS